MKQAAFQKFLAESDERNTYQNEGELMDELYEYDLYKIITELRTEWKEIKECADGVELDEDDKKDLKPIEKIKLVMTRNKDDEEELYNVLGTKDARIEWDRQFKNPKSNFKIAIVVDMWLTGFDVPELNTIYIDKPIQQHSLIQTISRVNRVCEGKDKLYWYKEKYALWYHSVKK